jgi:hypothetical protein
MNISSDASTVLLAVCEFPEVEQEVRDEPLT